MYEKIKDVILRLILFLEDWVKGIQKLLAPAIAVGTVFTVVHSVLGIIFLFQRKLPASFIQGIRGIPYYEEIATTVVVISMATLVLSGGIIEVFRLFGFAVEFSMPPRNEDYGYWDDHFLIADILELILVLLPFVIAAIIVACVPTAFIIVHNIRKRYDQ